jgi:dihydroxyacetone kinase-like protein
MKKIINQPGGVVSELLAGMAKAYPELKYTECWRL